MKKINSVAEYLAAHPDWQPLMSELRTILQQTELTETIKWGAPTYCIDNKNVAAMGAFKHHAALWFFQGALLKDELNVLVNAQEGKTQALRQWRFQLGDKVNQAAILCYVNEAIANQKQGKQVEVVKQQKDQSLHPLLQTALSQDKTLSESFATLAPYKQREMSAHIAEAKREATQQSRLEKCLSLIKRGQGLHDKYKNC